MASRALFHPEPDGFTIYLPPLGFRALWQGWLFGLAFLGFLTLITLVCWFALNQAIDLSVRLILSLVLLVSAFGLRPLAMLSIKWLLEASLGRATVVVIGRQLYVHCRGLIFGKEWTWDASEIRAIAEEGGLQLLTETGARGFFHNRDAAELRWVAQLLRESLQVPDTPELAPGEVAIRASFGGKGHRSSGALVARPGGMEIRWHFLSAFIGNVTRFRLPKDPHWIKGIRLSHEEIRWLPPQADQPLLELDLNHEFDEYLFIWCEDREGLAAAVERYLAGSG